MKQIAPSILSADFANLESEIKRVEAAGADMLHIDVMDGHFVPNITIGAPVVKAVRKCSSLTFDVHLMISDPLKYIEDFAAAGADILTIHYECNDRIAKTLDKIAACNVKPSISVKPKSTVDKIFPFLDKVKMVLIMTVEPGFGGQSFMPDMLPKIRALRKYIDQNNLDVKIQIDGGINTETIRQASAAGADIFVAGNAVFSGNDVKTAIDALRSAAVTA